MKREVIIACDFSSREEVMQFLKPFVSVKPFLKIGMELFYKEGPQLVLDLKRLGYKIFLDLKLHDIPNTVKKAMKNIGDLGVDITNVHAGGGIEMMVAAKEGLDASKGKGITKLIAVTQLTSVSQEILEKELLIEKPIQQVVETYAKNALTAGLDGVVCSPLEAPLIQKLGMLAVTPGIRFSENESNDQKRIASPAMAKTMGASYIVVGRSITQAKNPLEAYLRCVKEFC